MQFELGEIFEKFSNVKFHGKPSRHGRVVPFGQTDVYMTKLTVVFRNFANAPTLKTLTLLPPTADRNAQGIKLLRK